MSRQPPEPDLGKMALLALRLGVRRLDREMRDLRRRNRGLVRVPSLPPGHHVAMEAAQVTDLPKRLRPEPARRGAIGSERDLRVLSELGWAGVLTTGHVERLAFPSRRRAQRRLRTYLDAGLVRAQLQGEAMHRDNVWTITKAGLEFIADRGVDTTVF